MNTSKRRLLGRILPSTFAVFFLFLSGCATHREIFSKTIIDSVEEIIVHTNSGPVKVLANIDSGAENAAIDVEFVEQHGLDLYLGEKKSSSCPDSQVRIKNSIGSECRKLVIFRFTIKGVYQDSIASVTDRSSLSTPALIGNNALAEFLIRPLVKSEQQPEEIAEAEEEKD